MKENENHKKEFYSVDYEKIYISARKKKLSKW